VRWPVAALAPLCSALGRASISGVAIALVACGDPAGTNAGAQSSPSATPQELTEASVAADKALDDGRLDDALTLARFVAERDPSERGPELLGRVWLAKATQADRSGNREGATAARQAAADAYRRAADRAPRNAALQDATAMVLDTNGEVLVAATYYDRATEAEPSNVGFRLHRANSLLRRKAMAEALADADRAIALAPDEAWAHAIRGEALTALHRLDDAIVAAQEARRLGPSETSFRVLHARILRAQGKASDAVELLVALDESLRASIAVAGELALAWNDTGRPERAASTWELVYRRAAPHERLRAALEAGRYSIAAKRREDAKSWLDIASVIAPNDPAVTELAERLKSSGS
jgi:tetratricopeptide (TPR) repeat protein